MAHEIFRGIDFHAGEGVRASVEEIYRRALELERRTLAHFQLRARTLPPGLERELYRELAAEEVEHVALLEGLESLAAVDGPSAANRASRSCPAATPCIGATPRPPARNRNPVRHRGASGILLYSPVSS
jgi:hypothetical protein